jgi:O-antigen/teichoic acid export membrane protein
VTLTRGVSWVGAGHVISQAAWFGSLFLIAGIVRPKAFGSVTIAMVMIQVAWLLVGSGTRGSFVVASDLTRPQVLYALGVNVATGLALGAAAALGGGALIGALAPGADTAVVQVLAFSIAIYGLSIVPLALLQKALLFKRHAASNAGAALLSSAIAVAAALLGMGVWALVLRQILFQLFLAVFAWSWAFRLLPRNRGVAAGRPQRLARPPQAGWFFVLALISFVALNIDFVIVGRFTNVARLGLYSLAFTIAFAPMTQFAWQIGKVLFPAAARTTEREAVGARAGKAVGLTAAVLVICVPPAIALAPVLLPRILGPSWRPMVLPFQILMVAGICHAVLAILREFMLGSGSVGFCVRVEAVWLIGMAAGLLAGVELGGIEGAAIAHVALVLPLAVVYSVWGTRRIGSSAAKLWGAVRDVLAVGALEVVVTVASIALLRSSGATPTVAACVGATVGFATAIAAMWRGKVSSVSVARALLATRKVGVQA